MANAGFPAFRIRVFAGSPEVDVVIKGLPSAQQALFEDGIPLALVGGRYEADSGLSVVERTNRAPVVRFGTSGLSYAVGIDVVTGNVVEVINDPSQHTNLINTRPVFFTQTVRALVERFPYYSRNAGYDEVDALAKELRNLIRSIDPEAAVPGNYWPGFVDDVQMGDFNTEDVLEWESRLGSWRQ